MTTQSLLEDNLGDIIQKARTGKGLSLADLARASGLTQAQLDQVEEGTLTLQPDHLRRLAEYLDLDPQKLVTIANGAWTPEPFPPGLKDQVILIGGIIGSYPVNGYILYDGQTGEAACIDTAYAPEKMLKSIEAQNLRLKYILLTHAHHDHMGGVETIKAKSGARLYLHRDEMPLFSRQSRLTPDGFVNDHFETSIGRIHLKADSTPGHTPGGVTYLTEGLCFVGDALFAGSTGRSMSPKGYQSLLTSLRQKVLSLPDDTVILPGHGPTTTVGEEKRRNPFF
ncbi:MAG: MBL fold metallo-hydrolase [Nitrospira sp.]|nr:MBL fold metallo-hydrolase [Nitrospira sp.]